MGTSCKGLCLDYKPKGIVNGLKYKLGCKRCTYCGLFLLVSDLRCPCCKTRLRNRARTKRI